MLELFHLKYQADDEYWARILKWNRHPDLALLSFLGVDEKFWKLTILNESASHENAFKDVRKSISIVKDLHFVQGKCQFS